MKRLKVIVVGAKFGEVYLQVLLRRKDLVDVVGILGKGGQHSLECSTKYNIPLYTSVSELPSGIDLACVIVRAGVMGGEGIQLSKELLQKGISVLHEQPIHYKELKECYVIAKKQKCFMGVSNLYRYIDATQSFIDLVNHLKKEEYVEYINVECGHQILYSVLSILFDLTDYARPFVIEQVITDIGPFDILYCRINDIPCILKIHNEVNSDDPDNFFYLFYKMQVGFKSGELQLEDPAGPILWYSRFVIPPDFNYEEKNCKEFDKSNVVIISEGSKYYDIFWNKWGEAIIKQVVIAGDYIIYDKAYNSNIQKQLYQSKQWHEVMKNIGYPREKSVCSYEENTIDRIQEFIYKKNIQKCDFASIFSNLNRKKILEIKHKLDKACLYSMLFTLKSEEKVFVGDILEVKKPYISERGKKDFSYVIDRWIKAYRIEEGIIYSCRNNPNKIALVDKERSFTYQETLEYAMVIKSELEKKNCKVGDYVGIMVNKSAFQVIAAIGILCTGAIFVPISSDLPSERKRKIIQNSNIHIIVLDIPLTESIEVQDVVYVDELFRDQKIIESAKLLENTQSAYVIYTSGSTGEPKGVEISHESVMNTILDMNERLSITENDVFIAISKMNFDLSIYDMFGCLIAGATLVIPDDDTVNPERWAELINHYGVTIWNSVPALMQILFVNEEAKGCKRISSLRNILLSGDWIPIDLPARIYEFLPDTRIISLGGATEASIWSVYHECNINEQYKKSIPYGKPLSNQTLYIWDENMRDCPIGVKGDLFIGGIGLAKGYMNSSDLTAQKFIVKGGERFYRTGDKGRYLLGGEIEFLGREDMQVKINGYRIELGEIESILCNYEPIYQAVVSVIKNKLLVAAVVFHNGSNASEADILIYLKMHLPQYMIPKKIVVWDSFPLTFNGKIDRKRIDENYSIEEMQKHMEGMSVDNNSANELLLMWREALHNSEIQLQDNLYDYGVDSLIMAQMASKIRNNYTKNEIPFDVLLRQLLNHPDVLSLYQYIENYSMPDKKLVQNIKNDGIGTINIFHENKNDTLQVLLHAGFGTMNCFRYLIEYMRLDNKGTIAGIAIKNSKRYCEMNPDNLIEILADEYVNLIIGLNKKKIQIIGYCISGLIAVEIARRLMERGLEIFDLVLIDSHPIQYQLEDELLMEITFLPSLGIEISQLGLGEISNEELYKAVLYLYNEFKKEIPSRSIQYLPDEYINLKKILLKLDCMEKRQRFELYSKMALEKAENQFPVDMCIDLFAAYKQSFKAAQFVPEVYAGNIRFLLAEESTSFIPDNDEETLAFWKNTCLDDMSVEMIKGNHITCTENKENACTLCKKITKCFQD